MQEAVAVLVWGEYVQREEVMLQDADRQLSERFKGSLIEHGVPVYKTIVFGSRARGDAETDADLDVLVLVEHLHPTIRKTISHCAWKVSFDTGVLV